MFAKLNFNTKLELLPGSLKRIAIGWFPLYPCYQQRQKNNFPIHTLCFWTLNFTTHAMRQTLIVQIIVQIQTRKVKRRKHKKMTVCTLFILNIMNLKLGIEINWVIICYDITGSNIKCPKKYVKYIFFMWWHIICKIFWNAPNSKTFSFSVSFLFSSRVNFLKYPIFHARKFRDFEQKRERDWKCSNLGHFKKICIWYAITWKI